MRTTTWFVIGFVVSFCIGQDSRPDSKPTAAPATKDGLFHPEPSDKGSTALITFAKGKLAEDWVAREKPKPVRKTLQGSDLNEKFSDGLRKQAGSYAFENNIPAVRGHVETTGLLDKSGAHVLPLGRFDWEKPPIFLKPGESGKSSVICVLGSTAKLPLGDVKGLRVKGEFQDKDGKRIVDFNEKSLAASPPNGVFLIAIPAGKALSGAPEFDGFQFKLTEVQVLR